jgi:DNA repair exonuclease SbcCD ATPase subunit
VTYQDALRAYNDFVTARARDVEVVIALGDVNDRVEDLRSEKVEAERYEMAYAMWTTQRAEYERRVAELQAKEEEANEIDRARKALKAIRSRVKEHLVPSLSAVASRLLSEMTGGQRTAIDVNEDFEIVVDGQDIDTLSGSGKAVANLALRIGLGQVLTNKVFPLFMGDEVDAAMDQSRAESTAAALRNLSSSIAQVVVVSHKTPEADNYIQLM